MSYQQIRTDVLAEAATRALIAYYRPGPTEFIDTRTRNLLDDVLRRLAEQYLIDLERVWQKERGHDTVPPPTSNHTGTIMDLLHVIAALRAAFDMSRYPTGAEHLAALAGGNANPVTPAGDELRMHLLAVHHNGAALDLTDMEAHDQHTHEHRKLIGHPYDEHTWTVAAAKTVLTEQAEEGTMAEDDVEDTWDAFHRTVGRITVTREEANRG